MRSLSALQFFLAHLPPVVAHVPARALFKLAFDNCYFSLAVLPPPERPADYSQCQLTREALAASSGQTLVRNCIVSGLESALHLSCFFNDPLCRF